MWDYPCGVAHVDGSSCGLEQGHRELHEFSVLPPDEYYEDEEESKMAKIKVSDAAAEAGAASTTNGANPSGAKTVSLTFSTETELAAYAKFAEAAKEDDRSINSYLVRVLTGKESNPITPPAATASA